MSSEAHRRMISQDAVIVVPGIMGSALVDQDDEVWGFRRLSTYARMWRERNSPLAALALDDNERAGRYGRLRATRLIEFPAWAPFLCGLEPYTRLVNGLRHVVLHRDAVRPFPYDWRLPIEYNARRLARCAHAHLREWAAHSAYLAHRREIPGSRPARLVLVAHSMGGLLCRALPLVADEPLDIRATVTLGTPFDGAAKATMILNQGAGGPLPLPRKRLRDLAATLPGVHDLLPHYRCVDLGDTDPRGLTPDDVAALGGDRELAEMTSAFHRRTAAIALPGHHALIGTAQPTVQTIRLGGGRVVPQEVTFTPLADGGFERDRQGRLVRVVDEHGDGTVPRTSATPPLGRSIATLAQQHGAIARSAEAVQMACDVVAGRDADAPRLGAGDLGLDVPDVVAPGQAWSAVVTGVEGPNDAGCVVLDEDGLAIDHPPLHRRDGRWQVDVVLPENGIFRLELHGGGTSAVTQLVLADSGDTG